mmetsp:Transcript_1254/g.3311  ORF Transcript_1254/g.3311 Transcript_1254/m.3311 type:complete len:240 (+) Transcript_1254:71-790(+)
MLSPYCPFPWPRLPTHGTQPAALRPLFGAGLAKGLSATMSRAALYLPPSLALAARSFAFKASCSAAIASSRVFPARSRSAKLQSARSDSALDFSAESRAVLRRVTRLASSSSWYPGGPISIPRLITTSLTRKRGRHSSIRPVNSASRLILPAACTYALQPGCSACCSPITSKQLPSESARRTMAFAGVRTAASRNSSLMLAANPMTASTSNQCVYDQMIPRVSERRVAWRWRWIGLAWL